MKIIAPYRDYYDCVQRYGHDHSITYFRKPEAVKYDKYKSPFPRSHSNEYVVVGFCGVLYPAEIISRHTATGIEKTLCYNINEIDSYVAEYCDKQQQYMYFTSKYKRYKMPGRDDHLEFFSDYKPIKNNFAEWFVKHRSPLFLYDSASGVLTYNTCLLKSVEFYRVFAPQQAYQEIEMWLGNQASPEKPIPVVDDVTMLEAKGFDKKTSFRKAKSK